MLYQGKKILIFVENVYEDMELQFPLYRLREEGIEVVVAGPESGVEYQGKYGYPCRSDIAFTQAYAEEYDGLVIPGGFAPDKLRRDPHVLAFTKQMHDQKKPIAFICHAGWVPISAKVLKGVRCTSTPAIRDDLINAGAEWVDEEVVIDRHFVSSRKPADLPWFCQGILQLIGTSR